MMIPKAFDESNIFMNLENNNEEPNKKSINKNLNNATIIDIEEGEIENAESDCTDLIEPEVIECETEDIGTSKKTGSDAFEAIRVATEFMKYSPYGYNF